MNAGRKKKLVMLLPYAPVMLFAANLGEAWRLAEGRGLSERLLDFCFCLGPAFRNPLPGLHAEDLFTGFTAAAVLWLGTAVRRGNRKKLRPGTEYGSARWGGPEDIAPFMDPVFEKNVILTATERLMMSNRPKDPKNARNKNVLVIGGSGSGKTRFWIKPNLLQMNSSIVLTDPNS